MSRRGTGDSDGRRREEPDEDTGWINDLRNAKKADSGLNRTDFSGGGTDRWAKLSALSGDPGAPPPPPADAAKGRRRAPEPEPEPQLPRRAPKASPEPPPTSGPPAMTRQTRPPEEPDAKSLIGRRSRREAEPVREPAPPAGGRRGRPVDEPDPKSLIGRRARREAEPVREPEPEPPLAGRRSRPEPEPVREPEPPMGGRRARPVPEPEKEPLIGRRARREAEPFPMPDNLRDPGPRRPGREMGEPPPTSAPPSAEPSRRRTLFGPSADGPRRRPIFGDRGRAMPPPPPPTATPQAPISTPPRAPVSPPPMSRPVSTPPRAPVSPPSVSSPPISPSPMMPSPVSTPPRAPVSPSSVSGPPRSAVPASPAAGGPFMPGGPGGPSVPAGPGGPSGLDGPDGPAESSPRVRLAAGVDMIRGARSEVRRQLREQQRLRMWTLIAIVVVVLGAVPFYYFALPAAARDPVITSLDALNVPAWAVSEKVDNVTGSRWCLMDCRYRERTAHSQRPIAETAKVYQEALIAAGWAPLTGLPGCPPEVAENEHASCWRRDEFTLDLWIREPAECAEDPLRKRPTVGPTASPGAGASGAPEPPAETDICKTNSSVTIKVFNAIADERLRWAPENPTPNPEMGELTDEDLTTPDPAVPTPTAS